MRDDTAADLGAAPAAGDRAPDAGGLRQQGVGFPLRLFDLLHGTEHLLLVGVAGADPTAEIAALAAFVQELRAGRGLPLRVAAVAAAALPGQPGITMVADRERAFAAAYAAGPASFLVRPDGYIGWRGRSWRDDGLSAHLDRLFPQKA